MKTNRLAEGYKLLVGLTGILVLLFASRGFELTDPVGWLLLMTLTVLAEQIVVVMPNKVILSVAFAMVLAGFLLFGPIPAAWINVLGSFVGNGLLHRRPLVTALFNAGQFALSLLAANQIYQWLGGTYIPLDDFTRNTWPVLAFVFGYMLVNHFFVNSFFYLQTGGRHGFREWKEGFLWELINNAITIPASFMVAYFYLKHGTPIALVVLFSVLASGYLLKLQNQLTAANRELSALYEVSQKLNAALDLKKIFELVADTVAKIVPYDTFILFLWDEDKQLLKAAEIRSPAPEQLQGLTFALGEGIVGTVAKTKEPELINDARTDPRFKSIPGDEYTPRSLLVIPLAVEGQLIGVLSVGRVTPGEYDPDQLRLLSILGNQTAVSLESAILYRRTEELAITDPMTGLYNYRYFYLKLGEELRRSRTTGLPLSLIYLDIDDFKKYNDFHGGHLFGDSVLKKFAEILKAGLRETDILARYAGDEFVVMLPATGREEALRVAERLEKAVEEADFALDPSQGPIRVGVSLGIATYPADGENESTLIHAADQAMYQEKGRVKALRPETAI